MYGNVFHKGNNTLNDLEKLCCRILRLDLNSDSIQPYLRYALRMLNSTESQHVNDEIQIDNDVTKALNVNGRQVDVYKFRELKRQIMEANLSRHPAILLSFLHHSADYKVDRTQTRSSILPNYPKNTNGMITPLPQPQAQRLTTTSAAHRSNTNSMVPIDSSGVSSLQSTSGGASSSVSNSNAMNNDTFNSNGVIAQISVTTANSNINNSFARTKGQAPPPPPVSRKPTGNPLARSTPLLSSRTGGLAATTTISMLDEVAESEILRELVFALMGVEGNLIKFDSEKQQYSLDPRVPVTSSVRKCVSRLAECGWLYYKLKSFVELKRSERSFGTIGQSFCAALHQQLTEYYRLMATAESQLSAEEDRCDPLCVDKPTLTLRRLTMWIMEPQQRLRWLAALTDICRNKKGGALVSEVYIYLHNGDPMVAMLVRYLLGKVVQPLYSTITAWIFEGELDDPFSEFFVASNPCIGDERLWHDKYSLRKSMIPRFITVEQAKKILLTGKSINFLRQVCRVRANLKEQENVKVSLLKHAESLFNQELDPAFECMIATAYKETSRHLLDVLVQQYSFLEHLKAMRRYLLLGQGDFMRHLMELLEADLAQPATSLYVHNLSSVLETAIRSTNAQYDEPDILQRLDVRMLEISPGDTGWDVFSLDYRVDGPISTVFTPDCISYYLRSFNFLWRAKRMEHILSVIWRRQARTARLLRTVPECSTLLHNFQLLAAQMSHLVQQVQYYISFEVLECAWLQLLERVQGAPDLDHVIEAHKFFLSTVVTRCLLDDKSRDLLSYLRAIFDQIISYEELQSRMLKLANEELDSRQRNRKNAEERRRRGQWAQTDATEMEEKSRADNFRKELSQLNTNCNILRDVYRDMVLKFLNMLAKHPDYSLRFLSSRINFNGYYSQVQAAATIRDNSTVTRHPSRSATRSHSRGRPAASATNANAITASSRLAATAVQSH